MIIHVIWGKGKRKKIKLNILTKSNLDDHLKKLTNRFSMVQCEFVFLNSEIVEWKWL